MDNHDEAYGLDAAGQKVYEGDFVMAALPNVPAVHRPLALHPCKVLLVQNAGFKVIYAGDDVRFRKWSMEPFLRWRFEVVKADLSALGLANEAVTQEEPSCQVCRHRFQRIECDV